MARSQVRKYVLVHLRRCRRTLRSSQHRAAHGSHVLHSARAALEAIPARAKPSRAMPCHAMPCPPMVVLPWQRMGSGLGPGIPRALAPPPPPSLRAPYHVRSKVALVSDLQAARGSTGLLGCCRRSTIGIRVASCTSTGQHDQHERRWHQHAAASPPPAAPAPASTPRDGGWWWAVGGWASLP